MHDTHSAGINRETHTSDAHMEHHGTELEHGPVAADAMAHIQASHAGHTGHSKHEGHDPEAFRKRFWLSLLLTVPVVLFSEMDLRASSVQ
jgi:Cu2+-exporting ATPase